MTLNQQKEQFSNAYLRAVASVAGYSVYKPEVDDDSVDVLLAATGGLGTVRSPRLEIQLKCTGQEVIEDNLVNFSLPIKNYNDLRANTLVPRILVVVLVPESLAECLTQSEEQLVMRRCGYWFSLRGSQPTSNESRIIIRIPRQNQFTVGVLQHMMEMISSKGAI